MRWVHLRDHEAPLERFAAEAAALADRLRADAPDVRLSVNTHAGVAHVLGAGLHTGACGPSVAVAREAIGPNAVLGYSAHASGEAARAAREGADYVFFSPVYPTTSKPGAAGQGIAALAAAVRAPAPIYALGGLTPERVLPCLEAGAYGVAVLSGILHAASPAAAATAYRDALGHAASRS